ncbi:MAG: hypothetical protein U0797_18000 [Gemmataceae bacterium]
MFQNNGGATFANLNWASLGPQLAAAKTKEDFQKAIAAPRQGGPRPQTPHRRAEAVAGGQATGWKVKPWLA